MNTMIETNETKIGDIMAETLKNEIKMYENEIGEAKEHDRLSGFYQKKAEALTKLAKYENKNTNLTEALNCYNFAIKYNNGDNESNYVNRIKIHKDMNNYKEAVKEMAQLKDRIKAADPTRRLKEESMDALMEPMSFVILQPWQHKRF